MTFILIMIALISAWLLSGLAVSVPSLWSAIVIGRAQKAGVREYV